MPLKCVAKKGDDLILYINGIDTLSITDVEEFNTFFKSHLNGPDQFKTFFDLRKAKSVSMDVLYTMAKYMTSFEDLAREKVLGNSILVEGFILEQSLKLLFSIKPPTTPTKITTCLDEACDYLNSI